MSKKTKLISLCGVLALLAVFIFGVMAYASHNTQINPVGTYLAGVPPHPDALYFTLSQDNTYCLYKQFEILEEGTYSVNEWGICTLTLNGEARDIALSKKLIYFPQPDGQIFVFEKFSNVPEFINVRMTY